MRVAVVFTMISLASSPIATIADPAPLAEPTHLAAPDLVYRTARVTLNALDAFVTLTLTVPAPDYLSGMMFEPR